MELFPLPPCWKPRCNQACKIRGLKRSGALKDVSVLCEDEENRSTEVVAEAEKSGGDALEQSEGRKVLRMRRTERNPPASGKCRNFSLL